MNVFAASPDTADREALARYADGLTAVAAGLGTAPGDARWDDDAFAAKLELLAREQVHTVGVTFGCPPASGVDALHAADVRVAVTVTGVDEALIAASRGADLVVVQGSEAGGHQGTFDPRVRNDNTLVDALHAVRAAVSLPIVAAGGVGNRRDAQAALSAGADAVQVGTALLCSDESGASALHRAALLNRRFDRTELTRAFSGRWARGLTNRFVRDHRDAPSGYPQVHHMTKPIRSAAAASGDDQTVNLWAGTAWREVRTGPAGDIVRALAP